LRQQLKIADYAHGVELKTRERIISVIRVFGSFLISTRLSDARHTPAMKTPIPLFLIIFSITGVAFLSKSQAVVPPPDGGYAGGNTGEGNSALLGLTTGTYNTAVGIYSVLSLTDGSFCTGIGAGTLLANTANENTATGAGALLGNTTASSNTADGAFALFSNTTGEVNTAVGARCSL
jgi:hypothetical protein